MSVPRSPDFKAIEERPMLRFDSEVMDFRVVSESCSVTGSLMNKHANGINDGERGFGQQPAAQLPSPHGRWGRMNSNE